MKLSDEFFRAVWLEGMITAYKVDLQPGAEFRGLMDLAEYDAGGWLHTVEEEPSATRVAFVEFVNHSFGPDYWKVLQLG